MDLTLSTIMRDGEPYIEYALASTLPYCDAAVLVETGSQDRTLEIMKDMCSTHIKNGRWKVITTPWLGFGRSRELAMPYIPDGWLWKTGHDEIYFSERVSQFRRALLRLFNETTYPYIYPCEITFEGSHVHSQYSTDGKPGMNTRSQFFRIENNKYVYSWNNMKTNDDLSRTNRLTHEFQFLGPLCGNTETVKKDDKFTSFILDDTCPDSVHFAKSTQARLEWKTRSYRELEPDWPEESMSEPREKHLYTGPWPEVLRDKDGKLPSWLQSDIDKFYVE